MLRVHLPRILAATTWLALAAFALSLDPGASRAAPQHLQTCDVCAAVLPGWKIDPRESEAGFRCISYFDADQNLTSYAASLVIVRQDSLEAAEAALEAGRFSWTRPYSGAGEDAYAVEQVGGYMNLKFRRRNFTAELSAPGASAAGWAAQVDQKIQELLATNPACPPPIAKSEGIDLSVERIEVVQAVQDANNSLPLVAGKSTVARVFVKLAQPTGKPLSGVTVRLRASGGGRALGGEPRLLNQTMSTWVVPVKPERAKTNDALNFLLPAEWTHAGSLMLRAEVQPPSGATDARPADNLYQLPAPVTFSDRGRLTVAYIRVCYPNKEPGNCPGDELDGRHTFAERVFPIADMGITYYKLPVPAKVYRGEPFDKGEFASRLRKYYDLAERREAGQADQLFAWLPDTSAIRGGGSSDPLWDSPVRSGRVAWAKDFGRRPYKYLSHKLLAHELAHNFGLRHTGGNDIPLGCRSNSPVSRTYWTDPDSRIREYGFDPRSKRGVISREKFDLMSYCAPPVGNIWISPVNYRRLFDSNMAPVTAYAPAGPGVAPAPGGLFAPLNARQAGDGEYLIVGGSVRADDGSGQLDPAYRVTSSVPAEPFLPTGNHCLRLGNDHGSLAQHCFNLPFEDRENVASPVDTQFFSLKVPYVAGTTRVSLMSGQTELARLDEGPFAPSIAFSSPGTGESWRGQQTVSWSGQGASGRRVSYVLLYSPAGRADWLPIDVDLEDTSLTLDTAELTPGDVVFRLLASDGLNTAQLDSPVVRIEPQPRSPGTTTGSAAPGQTAGGVLGFPVATLLAVALLVAALLAVVAGMLTRRRAAIRDGSPGVCYNCGARVHPGVAYCGLCGAPQRTAAPPARRPVWGITAALLLVLGAALLVLNPQLGRFAPAPGFQSAQPTLTTAPPTVEDFGEDEGAPPGEPILP